VPLRSSWSKGRSATYAYYLCQTKTCEAYGKSIARDKAEADIGDLIKTLEPTPQLIALAKALFRHAWDQRMAQAQESIRSGQRQIKAVEKQIEALLARIMESNNITVIEAYEDKITKLQRSKIILDEQLANQAAPQGSYAEKLEPVLTFLANPWKLWETGNVALRRTVLKLAFADRIQYDRNEGARTSKISLPFKVLERFADPKVCNGAGGETRSHVCSHLFRFTYPLFLCQKNINWFATI
jgi:hypothetical protein